MYDFYLLTRVFFKDDTFVTFSKVNRLYLAIKL